MLRVRTLAYAVFAAGLIALAGPAPPGAAGAGKVPRKLKARVVGGDVVLRWRPVAHARRYLIHRKLVGAGASRWMRRPFGVTTRHRWRDDRVRGGRTYAYRVAARLRSGRLTRASRTVRIKVRRARGPRLGTPPRPVLPRPTRFVSTTGNDAGNCTAVAPCRSFDRAYRQASPGQVVQVAAGSYGGQTIGNAGRAPGGAPVYFVPAPGAAVTTGEIEVYGTGVEIWDMTTNGWYVKTGANGVTFRGVDAQGAIFITSASNVSVIGGSVGPGDSTDPQIKAADTSGSAVPTNILIDGVDFHDWTRNADPDAHIECLQFGAGENVVIRNSQFRNCETQGLFFRSWGGTAHINNVTIENNWFDATTDGYYPIKVGLTDGQVYRNIAIRYNSGLQPFIVDPGSSANVTWVGNVAPRPSSACTNGQTFRFNVWAGAKCGPTDKNAPLRFVNAAAMDLHLAPGSPAISAGDPADHPARDRDGQPRPIGGLPDAGADER
jgi:hypothetical protein